MARFTEEWNKRREQTDKPVTRIASFNLLVVSRGGREEGLQEVLQGLAKSHPSRTIWSKIDSDREWSNSTGRLHLGCGNHGDQVCSEQIQICCSNEPQRVSSLLLPLIRSGLPTHLLWWHAGPPEGDLFDRLADRCTVPPTDRPDDRPTDPPTNEGASDVVHNDLKKSFPRLMRDGAWGGR